MKLARAVRLNVGPVMPGAAACAAAVSSKTTTTITTGTSRVIEIALFIFIGLMAALLLDDDFSHQPTKVLGIVGQMVKLGGVEVIGARGHAVGIQNHIERFATTQGDRVGEVSRIVASQVTQQARVD